MRKIVALFALCCIIFKGSAQNHSSLYEYSAKNIEGNSINLSKYLGKKLLVVNTASYCGYTPQFADLEKLYTQYKKYNFEIIGFPCNDFGKQDPNSDSVINIFCTSTYNVTFQMMSKISIVKGDTAPVYKWLQSSKLNGVKTTHVDWNFNKYLIDEKGHWVKHFSSATIPLDTAITNWIKSPTVPLVSH